MNVLVMNSGSATVKFQIIETDQGRIERDEDRPLARGVVERVGSHALLTFQAEGQPKWKRAEPIRDHRAAVDTILRWVVSESSRIESIHSLADIHAVGHRVVHGGERFRASVRIDDEVIEGIEDCIELAPLHNPANLKGIRAVKQALGPGVPQVAVFDTAFHSTLPESAYLYGIPYPLYRRHKIRKYGFHGTSHRYVAYRYRTMQDVPREQVRLITLHLGNGCSACAIQGGNSVQTSMGFTPLPGLLMGTRSGDLDPSVLEYLHHKEGLSFAELDTLLNKQSGLLGISGLTGDMRELLAEAAEKDDRRAKLAIEMFCRRVRSTIGAYLAEAGPVEAVCFTGGIGENASEIRRRVLEGLEPFGIRLDPARNDDVEPGADARITTEDSPIAVWVIPTNEELLIARDTYRVVEDRPRRW